MYGWFSYKAYDFRGGCVYLNEQGQEITVTEVTDKDHTTSYWPDSKCVGIVTSFVRRIRPLPRFGELPYWESEEHGIYL